MAEGDSPRSDRAGGWRLSNASSAYLRSAQEQAIEWYPWGPQPFEIARRTGRPILLDIGAAWCHWCHVMDEGTYSDPEVARLLQNGFVAVKVDRDEYPEVDRRFQRQVSALTGQGGWPLTAFLTPDGDVFLGGTYFPAQDGMGRPGFRRVLKEVARLYREEPDRIRENSRQVQAVLARSVRTDVSSVTREQFLSSTRGQLHQSYDLVNGGFGFAPKFPHPTAVSFLLWDSFRTKDPLGDTRALETLLRMADGGMYDHVGGGFHRYAVDEGWHIPHFEKMGADNAALLHAYTEGARRFGSPRLVETVRGLVDWSRDVLGDPAGGFAASQDADNAPGDDGSYFTWSRSELKSALEPDAFLLVTRVFGVGSDGRMPHDPDRNVLFRLMSPAEAAEGLPRATEPERILSSALQTLREVRSRRPTPFVDRALYADINGSFLRGFAAAGAFLGDRDVIAVARRTADRFLREAYSADRGMAHRLDGTRSSGYGHLEDQAKFALGLVELAGVTQEVAYAHAARDLLGLIDREFRGDGGLLRDLSPRLYDGPRLAGLDAPSYPLEDSPHLAANAAAALAFERFASLTEEEGWKEKAAALSAAMTSRLEGAGLFGSGAALVAGLLETEPARVVVEGSGAEADRLFGAASSAYHPNAWVFRGRPPSPFSLPEELHAAANAGTGARALVCFGTRCLPPISDPAGLARSLREPSATPR